MQNPRLAGVIASVITSIFTALTLLGASASFAQTQTGTKPFEPQVGQQGKDVVWVPTPQSLVDRMLDLAKVTAQDVVMDLGSGDGRTVITAAKRGATATGIEYNPEMVELSKTNATAAGVSPAKAAFMKADLFETDLTKASVITMFLLPQINLKLRPTILNLKPGTRVVSNTFTMDDWTPDETATITEDCTSWCTALLWIVPAKVEGTWRMGQGELTLTQTFQQIKGTLRNGGNSMPVEGKLLGEQISFRAGSTEYSGRVTATGMQGSQTSGAAWTATR
jgi:SAM-dependent methyltransferase